MVEDPMTDRVWCNGCGEYHYEPTVEQMAQAVQVPDVPLPTSPAARLAALVDMYQGVPDENGNLAKLITREQFLSLTDIPSAMAPWLPEGEPEPREFFGVERTATMARFADRRVAPWLVAALRWPLAMMAGAEHWRRRTGGTLSFDTARDGEIVSVVATWRAGAWSMTEGVWAPDDLAPTDERLEHGLSDLDRITLAWVDAGCPR